MTDDTPAKVIDLADRPQTRAKPKPPEGPPQRALALCFAPLSEDDATLRCLSDAFRVVLLNGALRWVCVECGREHDGSVGRWVVL